MHPTSHSLTEDILRYMIWGVKVIIFLFLNHISIATKPYIIKAFQCASKYLLMMDCILGPLRTHG